MFHGQVNGQVICFFTRSFDLAWPGVAPPLLTFMPFHVQLKFWIKYCPFLLCFFECEEWIKLKLKLKVTVIYVYSVCLFVIEFLCLLTPQSTYVFFTVSHNCFTQTKIFRAFHLKEWFHAHKYNLRYISGDGSFTCITLFNLQSLFQSVLWIVSNPAMCVTQRQVAWRSLVRWNIAEISYRE